MIHIRGQPKHKHKIKHDKTTMQYSPGVLTSMPHDIRTSVQRFPVTCIM